MTHLIMYHWDRCPKMRIRGRAVERIFVPFAYCKTRYRTMAQLQADWRQVTCRPCKKAGKNHEQVRNWISSPEGKRASARAWALADAKGKRRRDHDA